MVKLFAQKMKPYVTTFANAAVAGAATGVTKATAVIVEDAMTNKYKALTQKNVQQELEPQKINVCKI